MVTNEQHKKKKVLKEIQKIIKSVLLKFFTRFNLLFHLFSAKNDENSW